MEHLRGKREEVREGEEEGRREQGKGRRENGGGKERREGVTTVGMSHHSVCLIFSHNKVRDRHSILTKAPEPFLAYMYTRPPTGQR